MARAQNYDSASSQFFICQEDCDFLDGQYAAFGNVVDGIDVVDKIADIRTDYNDRPIDEVVIEDVQVIPDEIPDCIFCKIVAGQIPSTKVYEDRYMLAFKDINPQAAVHVVIVPKKHIADLNGINESNSNVIAAIFEKIPRIAEGLGLTDGYRIVSNCGKNACQSVNHLHFHLLGGEKLSDRMA